jgi:hypothetical protein
MDLRVQLIRDYDAGDSLPSRTTRVPSAENRQQRTDFLVASLADNRNGRLADGLPQATCRAQRTLRRSRAIGRITRQQASSSSFRWSWSGRCLRR